MPRQHVITWLYNAKVHMELYDEQNACSRMQRAIFLVKHPNNTALRTAHEKEDNEVMLRFLKNVCVATPEFMESLETGQ